MSFIALFEHDSYLRECDADVVETGRDGSRTWVALSRTVLYPEGGGQPADRGWLDGVPVIDVQRAGGTIRHFGDVLPGRGPVRVKLDWPRRFDHMQQHSGQHILTAVAQDRFGWPTTAFHLGEEVSDVELAVPSLGSDRLAALEEAVVAEIRAARPVSCRVVARDALAHLEGVRTRGLPDGHTGEVRLVEIDGVDRNTCGGTHVRATAEIETIVLLRAEPMRGGTRVTFVAGGRARRRLASHESRNAELRTLLGAPDDELLAAVAARIDGQHQLEKRLRAAEEALAEALAHALAGRSEPLAEAHLEGRDLPFLQNVGRCFAALAADRLAFLTGSGPSSPCLLLVAGESCQVDVQALGHDVAALLDGRGGGSGRLFQGKAAALQRRNEAVSMLRAALEAA